MIVSFGWTTPALVSSFVPGEPGKSCTRRAWAEEYAARVWAADARDGFLWAWNASPRVVSKDPHPVCKIRLLCEPAESNEYPEEDYEAEGFPLLQRLGLLVDGLRPRDLWRQWKTARPTFYVVRFMPFELTPEGTRDLERLCL